MITNGIGSVNDGMTSDQAIGSDDGRRIDIIGILIIRTSWLTNMTIITDDGIVPYNNIIINDGIVSYPHIFSNFCAWTYTDITVIEFHLVSFCGLDALSEGTLNQIRLEHLEFLIISDVIRLLV
jgi:hypothetical protein